MILWQVRKLRVTAYQTKFYRYKFNFGKWNHFSFAFLLFSANSWGIQNEPSCQGSFKFTSIFRHFQMNYSNWEFFSMFCIFQTFQFSMRIFLSFYFQSLSDFPKKKSTLISYIIQVILENSNFSVKKIQQKNFFW